MPDFSVHDVLSAFGGLVNEIPRNCTRKNLATLGHSEPAPAPSTVRPSEPAPVVPVDQSDLAGHGQQQLLAELRTAAKNTANMEARQLIPNTPLCGYVQVRSTNAHMLESVNARTPKIRGRAYTRTH